MFQTLKATGNEVHRRRGGKGNPIHIFFRSTLDALESLVREMKTFEAFFAWVT